jgi:hypothetical protein
VLNPWLMQRTIAEWHDETLLLTPIRLAGSLCPTFGGRSMVLLRFTANIQRHIACPPREVAGGTVREALDDYFRSRPETRGYVLDDQGRLRRHMAIFVDGRPLSDRHRLSDPITPDTTLDVFQALSGG